MIRVSVVWVSCIRRSAVYEASVSTECCVEGGGGNICASRGCPLVGRPGLACVQCLFAFTEMNSSFLWYAS